MQSKLSFEQMCSYCLLGFVGQYWPPLPQSEGLVYLVLDTWSSEGRKGLLTVAEEVLPKAVRPSSLIWDRPRVLASRGRCSLRHTADATSALTSWILM